jgi:hypothetical protein
VQVITLHWRNNMNRSYIKCGFVLLFRSPRYASCSREWSIVIPLS